MPVVLDRLPLPNLSWYTGLSVVLLACSFYYAGIQVTQTANWKNLIGVHLSKNSGFFISSDEQDVSTTGNFFNVEVVLEIAIGSGSSIDNQSSEPNEVTEEIFNKVNALPSSSSSSIVSNNEVCSSEFELLKESDETRELSPELFPEIFSFMIHEPLCIWTLINMAYCVLILLGTAIQRLVFGELRVSEQQHIKDKFWNFVFYKFIFVFGVMNVQAMDEVILWCSWFSVLGFLHLLAQLCKDRFEYLSFSVSTPRRSHIRLLGLLSLILAISLICFIICIIVGLHAGINIFAFMAAECVLLMVRTLHVITRYCLYLWDISFEGLWEKRGTYSYLTELLFDLSELAIDMVHHIHMLLWSNMFLTMASLVICMQLRLLFYQLQHKVKFHINYIKVLKMINTYPEITRPVSHSDDFTCAICWELVDVGRHLPCGHIFHSSCLQAWMHQDLTCPTCREHLKFIQDPSCLKYKGIFSGLLSDIGDSDDGLNRQPETQRNNYPSPEGSSDNSGWRYVSWLPSFSVEQNHTQLTRHQLPQTQPATTSQLHSLAVQIQQMFPDVSYNIILEDLHRTHSLEATIDNILERRIVSFPPMFSTPEDSPIHSTSYAEIEACDQVSEDYCGAENDFFDAQSYFDSNYSENSLSDCLSSEMDFIEPPVSSDCGGQFSKNPEEREENLRQRKKLLLLRAKKKYLAYQMPIYVESTS